MRCERDSPASAPSLDKKSTNYTIKRACLCKIFCQFKFGRNPRIRVWAKGGSQALRNFRGGHRE